MNAITPWARIAVVLTLALTACGLPYPKTANNAASNGQDGNASNGNNGPTPSPVTGPTLATVGQLSQTDGGPYYMGRFDTSDPNGPQFAWSGSSIYVRFTGTGISITLNELTQPADYNTTTGTSAEGNEYDVVIDGGKPTLLVPQFGRGTYLLAGGLSNASHSVVVTKRTEAEVGTAQFLGFTVNGQPLAAPQTLAVDRRIEIIGDSISCGYGVLGADASCTFSPATENESDAYGWLAASSLEAEVHIDAWSGKGVYRNNDGTTTNTMLDLWQLSLPANTNATWDFNSWQPQVVVINLGTNDFATGIPYAPAFEGAYSELVAQVRANYPNAMIFCALGPMMSDTYPVNENALSTARKYIQTVVQGSLAPKSSSSSLRTWAARWDATHIPTPAIKPQWQRNSLERSPKRRAGRTNFITLRNHAHHQHSIDLLKRFFQKISRPLYRAQSVNSYDTLCQRESSHAL